MASKRGEEAKEANTSQDKKAPADLQHRPQRPQRWAEYEEDGDIEGIETAEQIFLTACQRDTAA